jgi:hypothetical protein
VGEVAAKKTVPRDEPGEKPAIRVTLVSGKVNGLIGRATAKLRSLDQFAVAWPLVPKAPSLIHVVQSLSIPLQQCANPITPFKQQSAHGRGEALMK